MSRPDGCDFGHVFYFFMGSFLVLRAGEKCVDHGTIVDDDDEVAAYRSVIEASSKYTDTIDVI